MATAIRATGPSPREAADMSDDELLDVQCPRCKAHVTQRFHGPCAGCCDELRATYAGLERDVADEAYVPKMNVTPNAVALKD